VKAKNLLVVRAEGDVVRVNVTSGSSIWTGLIAQVPANNEEMLWKVGVPNVDYLPMPASVLGDFPGREALPINKVSNFERAIDLAPYTFRAHSSLFIIKAKRNFAVTRGANDQLPSRQRASSRNEGFRDSS